MGFGNYFSCFLIRLTIQAAIITICPIGKNKKGIKSGTISNNLFENNNVWIGLFKIVEIFLISQGLLLASNTAGIS